MPTLKGKNGKEVISTLENQGLIVKYNGIGKVKKQSIPVGRKYKKGEGVYSLARSFMYAGVPSMVMSLWRVSDASTSQLMPACFNVFKNLG